MNPTAFPGKTSSYLLIQIVPLVVSARDTRSPKVNLTLRRGIGGQIPGLLSIDQLRTHVEFSASPTIERASQGCRLTLISVDGTGQPATPYCIQAGCKMTAMATDSVNPYPDIARC